jgi:hypothetical protein
MMRKMSKQYWNDLTKHALHLVNALNKELGSDSCYLDPISTKMLIKFKGCPDKSNVMVYLKHGELVVSEKFLKGFAIKHIKTVKNIIDPMNFYSIVDNVKQLNPKIIDNKINTDTPVKKEKRGRGRPAGYKTSEETKEKQRKARLLKLAKQLEPKKEVSSNKCEVDVKQYNTLMKFVEKMAPIHRAYAKSHTDNKCWYLHGILHEHKQRIRDLHEHDVSLKQLNDAIKDVLDGKIEENLHYKLKNIVNDILTIIK